jgi:hypothetical protein
VRKLLRVVLDHYEITDLILRCACLLVRSLNGCCYWLLLAAAAGCCCLPRLLLL